MLLYHYRTTTLKSKNSPDRRKCWVRGTNKRVLLLCEPFVRGGGGQEGEERGRKGGRGVAGRGGKGAGTDASLIFNGFFSEDGSDCFFPIIFFPFFFFFWLQEKILFFFKCIYVLSQVGKRYSRRASYVVLLPAPSPLLPCLSLYVIR